MAIGMGNVRLSAKPGEITKADGSKQVNFIRLPGIKADKLKHILAIVYLYTYIHT
jgi:hypothetical protein